MKYENWQCMLQCTAWGLANILSCRRQTEWVCQQWYIQIQEKLWALWSSGCPKTFLYVLHENWRIMIQLSFWFQQCVTVTPSHHINRLRWRLFSIGPQSRQNNQLAGAPAGATVEPSAQKPARRHLGYDLSRGCWPFGMQPSCSALP